MTYNEAGDELVMNDYFVQEFLEAGWRLLEWKGTGWLLSRAE